MTNFIILKKEREVTKMKKEEELEKLLAFNTLTIDMSEEKK